MVLDTTYEMLVERVDSIEKTVQQLKATYGSSARLDALERRQEEIVKLLNGIRQELAGISTGMTRRSSFIYNNPGIRKDSFDFTPMMQQQASRKLSNVSVDNKGPFRPEYPVLEVDPWVPPSHVQKAIDSMIERQFLMSPWVREKRMRNQIRLILKMFDNWDKVQECEYADAARIIFQQFKHQKYLEESLKYTEEMGLEFIVEHMIEVGQFLKRKVAEKAAKSGKETKGSITNSKFWYEVRKKINEIQDQKKVQQRKTPTEESEEDSPFMYIQKGYYLAGEAPAEASSQDSSSSTEEHSENGD